MLKIIPSPNEPKQCVNLWQDPDFEIRGELYADNRLFLHLTPYFKKLKVSTYKRGLAACAAIKAAAAERGIPFLYTVVPDELVKWEQMLGFSDYATFTKRNGAKGYIHLMVQPTKDIV